MNTLIIYIIRSGIYLILFYSIFWVFFRKEPFFMFNRIYLMCSVVFSLILPFVRIPAPLHETTAGYTVWLNEVIIAPVTFHSGNYGAISGVSLPEIIYLCGMCIFLGRFVWMILQLLMIINKGETIYYKRAKIIVTSSEIKPFSFFSSIVLNRNILNGQQIDHILVHEKIHVRQLHSLDLILTELIVVLQWANPVFWLLKKSVKEQHEYLADEGVLEKGFDSRDYMHMLAGQAFEMNILPLANQFNHSHIKNRFTMITKEKSFKSMLIKSALVIPVLIAAVALLSLSLNRAAFARPDNRLPDLLHSGFISPQQEDSVCKVVDVLPQFPGGETALVDFIQKNIEYPETAKKQGTTGRVFVSFIIEKNGEISNVKVLRGIGSGCDEESVRVVSMMPSWKPGLKDGKPVRVEFNLPIQFSLSNAGKQDVKGE